MKELWRIGCFVLGMICLGLGAYGIYVNHRVDKEMSLIKQGIIRDDAIQHLSRYPLVDEHKLFFNEVLGLTRQNVMSDRIDPLLDKIVAETKSRRLRSTVLKFQADRYVPTNPYLAAELYIAVLKADPSDIHSKAMLERLYEEIDWTQLETNRRDAPVQQAGPKSEESDKEGEKGDAFSLGNSGGDI